MPKLRTPEDSCKNNILVLVILILEILDVSCSSPRRSLQQRVEIFHHASIMSPGANYYNHAPTFERLPNGHLVAAWSSGEYEGSPDYHVLLSRSTDDGLSWSAPIKVSDPEGDATAWAGVLFYRSGQLWMILSIGGAPGSGEQLSSVDMYLTSSTDEGKSWSPPRKIDTGKDRTYPPLQQPVLLSDNRLAFGFYWRNFNDAQTHAGILVASNDLSAWASVGDVSISGHRTLEPILTRESDGSLHMFLRTDLAHVYSATSSNEGRTWTTPSSLPIPNADTLSYVVRLDDGQYLVAWNNHPSVRDYLTLGVFSGPDLTELRNMLTVRREDKPSQKVGYPRIVLTTDRILLIYSVLEDEAPNRRHGDIWFESFPKSLPRRSGDLKLNQLPNGSNETLYDLTFPTPRRGWAVGEGGRILSTTDAGQTWKIQTSGSESDLHAVYFANEMSGVALGNGVALTTNDGGANWTTTNLKVDVSAAAFVDEKTGVAVGSRGEILRTTNGGASFQVTGHCSCSALFDVRNVGVDQLWATGSGGTILQSRDKGVSWVQLWLGTNEGIFGIAFDSTGQRGIAVGDHEVVFCSSNGGATWNDVSPSLSRIMGRTAERLRSAVFSATREAIIISDQASILRSSDLVHFRRQETRSLNLFQAIYRGSDSILIAGWNGRLARLTDVND